MISSEESTTTRPLHLARVTDEAGLMAASAVLTEVVHWLADRGEPLWKPEEFFPERMAPWAEAGQLYIARVGDEVVGTCLLQDTDTLFWPEDAPGEALYLHKLAVRRAWSGQGIATGILVLAQEEARRRGRAFLRLDCDGTRPALCSFYAASGFTQRETLHMENWTAARFERLVLPEK